MDENAQQVFLAAAGPKDWPRVALHKVPTSTKTIGSGVAVDTPPKVALPQVSVRNIRSSDDSMSFDIDRTGAPVLVKMSYFPNWKVSGAKGPYRVTPNEMVVIPTSTHVSLHYGYTGVDLFAYLLTIAGILLAVLFVRWGPVDFDAEPKRSPLSVRLRHSLGRRRRGIEDPDELEPALAAPERSGRVPARDRGT
jgi:hypothetical protein